MAGDLGGYLIEILQPAATDAGVPTRVGGLDTGR